MAEFGSRAPGTGNMGITSSPSPAQGKVAFKAGDGEGGGGGGGVRAHLENPGNRVSNGDCALVGTREETESAQPGSPGIERGCSTLQSEGKAELPKKTSIIKNAVVSFKELCGLSPVANLMQCILAVSTRLVRSDNTPLVVVNLSDQYPIMELQGIVPEVLKKIVTAYEMMIQNIKTLIENSDTVYEKVVQCQKAAMEFHEHLQSIGTKEGLKERKLQKAVESFTWNITILKGQADLLKYAKNEALENLKQIHYATVSCGLNKPGSENAEVSKPRRSLEAIPEKAGEENGE